MPRVLRDVVVVTPVTELVAVVLAEVVRGHGRAMADAVEHLGRDCDCLTPMVLLGAAVRQRLITNGGHTATWFPPHPEG